MQAKVKKIVHRQTDRQTDTNAPLAITARTHAECLPSCNIDMQDAVAA